MNKKDLESYKEKYGKISKNFAERFIDLVKHIKLSDSDLKKLKVGVRKLINSKWNELDFVIYFLPKSTPRPRSGRNGSFYVKGAGDNSKAFKEFIDNSEKEFGIITTPSIFLVDMYFPIPPGMNKIEKILAELKLVRPIAKPDWDNGGKTYSDMIQKHLLLEDSIIIDGRSRKFYSMKPRVEIRIKFMEKYDCKFNKKKIESWKFYKELEEKIEERDSII